MAKSTWEEPTCQHKNQEANIQPVRTTLLTLPRRSACCASSVRLSPSLPKLALMRLKQPWSVAVNSRTKMQSLSGGIFASPLNHQRSPYALALLRPTGLPRHSQRRGPGRGGKSCGRSSGLKTTSSFQPLGLTGTARARGRAAVTSINRIGGSRREEALRVRRANARPTNRGSTSAQTTQNSFSMARL